MTDGWNQARDYRPFALENFPVIWQFREGRFLMGVLFLLLTATFILVHVLFLDRIQLMVGILPDWGMVLCAFWILVTAVSAIANLPIVLALVTFSGFLVAFFGSFLGLPMGTEVQFKGQEGKPWMAIYTLHALPFLIWFLGRKRRPVPKYLKSTWQLTRERFQRSSLAQLGLIGVTLTYVLTFLAPLVAPYYPNQLVDIVNKNLIAPFSEGFLFGTDNFSRDIYSRILHGAWISMTIGIFAVSLSITIGLVVGLLAGYLGGKVDWFLMRLVDFLLSLPRLVLLLVILGIFRDIIPESLRIHFVIGILGVTGWMGTSRLVRGEVLSVKERDFVTAGRAMGLNEATIVFKHVAPNCLAPVIVSATLGIGGTILVEAGLSFLGLGVPPPTATWGAMVDQGREFMEAAPWITIIPGLAIVIAVTSFNLLGDGLRDAMDPKLASSGKVPKDLDAWLAEEEARKNGESPETAKA